MVEFGIPASACSEPALRPGTIERDRLVKTLLDGAVARILLVCAPGGHGKTSAVQLWSRADQRPFAWVHLGPVDDDPVHLVRHVAAALDVLAPLEPEVIRVLTGSGRPVDTDLLPSLGQVLAASGPIVLVLEDLHLLASSGSLGVVEGLFSYLPESSQIVLVSRTRPDLRLARRQLHGEVVEIGTDDLLMDTPEAMALFAHAGLELEPAEMEQLIDLTEGWPAGLGLAALAMRSSRRPIDLTNLGSDELAAAYLMEEMLDTLDHPTTDFLVRSSVLERMDSSLLDAVLDMSDSGRMLASIEASGNPFLVPLDNRHEWYRFHHLFGEMLQSSLKAQRPEECEVLRRRASRELEQRGDVDGAIRQAASGGESERAADLVLAHAIELIDDGRVGLLGQWIDLLGPELVDQCPAAAIAAAWHGIGTGDPSTIVRSIRAAERLLAEQATDQPLADGSPSLAVALASVRAMVALEGTDGVVRDIEIMRGGGGPARNPWWGYATALEGSLATLVGDNARGRELLHAGIAQVTYSPSFEAGYLGILVLLEVYESDLEEAERLSRKAVGLCDAHNLDAVLLVLAVYSGAALVAARRGRFDEARAESIRAQRLLARLGDMSPRSALRGYVALAQAAVSMGEYPQARNLAHEAAKARQRDPSCTYLNEHLDVVERTLEDVGRSSALHIAPLTAAELRILSYLPTHLSLQEIAEASYVSRNTVKSHTVSIYRKLAVASRAEAVAEARRLGLLEI
jgi:LuxR family transcriptional regulator, maltose regulon positive regulatory protein